MECLCSTQIFLYSSVWENGTCLFFRISYTAIWIFRVTLGNYPLHVIYAIPLKVFGFTLFEITHIYNTKVMLYNYSYVNQIRIRFTWLSRTAILGGFSFIFFSLIQLSLYHQQKQNVKIFLYCTTTLLHIYNN